MNSQKQIPLVVNISNNESKRFDSLIKEYRTKYIRTSSEILQSILELDNSLLANLAQKRNASEVILALRESVWAEYLKDEVVFNSILMKDLYKLLHTPKEIMDALIDEDFLTNNQDNLVDAIKAVCGEYSGYIFPYIYKLSLSNTQSRRSRAGKTFESIIYQIYNVLGYSYDSQNKVGRKMFDNAGLGKKVDSILPSIECFKQRRNKTIIGTMKTSLRERWQEVAEEIERTNIPEIHLLTCDEEISENKSDEMANHNITLVTYKWVAESEELRNKKNIISFEDYLFDEIPNILNYWNE
ncbi:MAG: type II restriction endonuclease [Rikenellaceae bacterium]